MSAQDPDNNPDNSAGRRPSAGRVAYVMTRFPKITETFILREMVELERQGWDILPFALVREREQVPHPGAAEFVARAHFFTVAELLPLLKDNLQWLLRHPGDYLRLLEKTIRLQWRSPGMLVRSLLCFPVAVRWARQMSTAGVQHIHAHFATHATYMAYVISQLTGLAYSFTAHAHDIYVNHTMLREKTSAATFVAAISDYNRNILVELAPASAGKVHVVHCGVDVQLFTSSPGDGKPARAAIHELRCLSVARFQEYKGQKYLIEACHYLRERNVPFRLVLVGDGPDRPSIEAAIRDLRLQEQIELTGWLPTEAVKQQMRLADVFVLPSVRARNGMMEGLPNVLMEAMSCEIPVVATELSGIPELVQHGSNGILTPPGDAVAIADALEYLWTHPESRLELGKAGRRRVEADFELVRNTEVKGRLLRQSVPVAYPI